MRQATIRGGNPGGTGGHVPPIFEVGGTACCLSPQSFAVILKKYLVACCKYQFNLTRVHVQVHKHKLDEVFVATVAAEFAGMSETCRAAFGKF